MVVLAQIALPPKVADSFVIASVLLAMIGTLFLAYDLLGRENGPLRWLTLVMICGLVSALVLATTDTILEKLFSNPVDPPHILQVLVLGGLMGFFTVILVELPGSKTRPAIFSRRGSLTGLTFGLIFGFVIKYILFGPWEAALVLGGSCAVITAVWQRITWEPSQAASNPHGVWKLATWEEPPHPRPHPFSRRRFLPGLGIGFVCCFVSFFILCKDAPAALLESVPFALTCGVISSTWRFINWEPPHPRPHLFSRKGFWNGFVAGFVPWLIYEIWESNVLLERVSGPVAGFYTMINLSVLFLVAGILALATALAGSIAQYILWRANRLPHSLLGAFGLVLVLLATGLQGVQPMIDLFNIK
ncbi:MAG TPA: hypothetical protein VEL31_08620 [Ktedonobacteraceae bacterium]|nr:hypothetical protein [Ktedonobacteraceae bacterium]